jgi:hypothetical protein
MINLNNKINMIFISLFFLLTVILSGCTSSERVASNLNYEAEEFKLTRRIVAVNGITDKPLFEIIGQCSIETGASYVEGTMEIVCKIGKDKFTKDFIYLSDNVLIIVEQLNSVDVPQYHYQIVFAPQSILPIPKIVGGNLGE